MTDSDARPPADPSGPGAPLRPHDPERIGGYRLLGYLGEGGMGVVFSARGPDGRLVAVKLVRAELAHDERFRARFRRETDNARRVPRFCTAELLDSAPDTDQPYLVTEFIDGPSLQAAVAGGQTFGPGELEQLGVAMATALDAIHGAGVVHRDLKPTNVLLSRVGPRVIDFGIARALEAAQHLTATGQIIGTPSFMAPEQFESGETRPATDVFAWGVVMVFAATGRLPFGGTSPAAVAYQIMHKEVDLSALAEPMRSIVARALRKDPAARPTARALLEMLGARPAPAAGEGAPPGAAGVPPVVPGPALAPEAVPAHAPARTGGAHPVPDAGPPAGAETGTLAGAEAAAPGTAGPATGGPAGPAGQGARPPGGRGRWRWGALAGAATTVVTLLVTFLVNPDLIERFREPELSGHWRGDYGDHYVRVDDNVVRMLYPDRDGRLIGTIDGKMIHGQWSEGTSEPRGPVDFRVDRNGKRLRLRGTWSEGEDGPQQQWNLERVDGRIPVEIARKLANPALFPPLREPAPEVSG